MSRVKTTAELRGYEGRDYGNQTADQHTITVKSHWNEEDFVTLRLGDIEVVVVAKDLIEAVRRCSR